MNQILLPTYNHIDQIKYLNNKYLISHLTDVQKQNGFVRIEYDHEDLKKIVINKEIVIATNIETVIGYYLIGKTSCNPTLTYQKNKAISLFDTNNIRFEKIGFGCQVCIDEAYRNNGLFGQMMNALTLSIKDKYTHLLCSVSDDNIISLKSHLNNGWQLIDSFETTKFFIYNTYKPNIE